VGQFAPDAVLDAIPLQIATATRLTVCSGQPADFAGIASVLLAEVTLTPGDGNGDFVVGDGDADGRKVRVAAQSALEIDASGAATHVALDDGSDLLFVTTCTSQALTAGGTVSVPAWDVEVGEPAGGAQVRAGFIYPGTAEFEQTTPHPELTTQLVWNQTLSGATVPAASEGLIFVWWSRPLAMQQSFWSGLFHAAYSDDFGTDVQPLRYMGMHPYPVPPNGPATENPWEISAMGGDNYINDQSAQANISEWDRKYWHVGLCVPNGGDVDYYFYYDYGNLPARYIPVLEDDKSDPTAANRAIIQGDAPWNIGNERFNGALSTPHVMVVGALSVSAMLAIADTAIADPFDPSLDELTWYVNPYPTSNSDISDKSGNGNDPIWVIGEEETTPALYQEE